MYKIKRYIPIYDNPAVLAPITGIGINSDCCCIVCVSLSFSSSLSLSFCKTKVNEYYKKGYKINNTNKIDTLSMTLLFSLVVTVCMDFGEDIFDSFIVDADNNGATNQLLIFFASCLGKIKFFESK